MLDIFFFLLHRKHHYLHQGVLWGAPEDAPESEPAAEPDGGSSGGGSWDGGSFLTIEKLRQRRFLRSLFVCFSAGREGSSEAVSLSASQEANLLHKNPDLLFMYKMPCCITAPSLILASPSAADAAVISAVIFWLLALLPEEPKLWITEGCLPSESSSLSSESRNLVCFPWPVAEGFFDVLSCTGGAAC